MSRHFPKHKTDQLAFIDPINGYYQYTSYINTADVYFVACEFEDMTNCLNFPFRFPFRTSSKGYANDFPLSSSAHTTSSHSTPSSSPHCAPRQWLYNRIFNSSAREHVSEYDELPDDIDPDFITRQPPLHKTGE